MSTPRPHPIPGPSGLDTDDLRVAFDDLLADSAGPVASDPDDGTRGVRDDQVAALDAAHELLADALTSLDTQR